MPCSTTPRASKIPSSTRLRRIKLYAFSALANGTFSISLRSHNLIAVLKSHPSMALYTGPSLREMISRSMLTFDLPGLKRTPQATSIEANRNQMPQNSNFSKILQQRRYSKRILRYDQR
mmetsp:Transcript_8022/g.17618  ORF Transcript_8022/g.17618 Transcript_8022/m.17618 type:complete len:119 (-) Transcript_8022:65-421(-)